jgi:hypothetical protein
MFRNKYIGYIAYDGKIKDAPPFVKVIGFSEMLSVASDLNAPLLIIGYENALKFYGEKFDILNKHIEEDKPIFWTFKKYEKRVEYEKDIKDFYSYIFLRINKKIKYYFISVFKFTLSKYKSFINIMNGEKEKIIYISKNTIYILLDDIIYGFSIDELNFIGISCDKALQKINSFKNTAFVPKSFKVSNEIKALIGNDYLTPYLYLITL